MDEMPTGLLVFLQGLVENTYPVSMISMILTGFGYILGHIASRYVIRTLKEVVTSLEIMIGRVH